MRSESEKTENNEATKVGIVYKLLLGKKVYIGQTLQSLTKRVRQRVDEAYKREENKGGYSFKQVEIDGKYMKIKPPFVRPYPNYRGLTSHIQAIAKRKKLLPIPNQSKAEINHNKRKLTQYLIDKATILEEVEFSSEEDSQQMKSELITLEKDYIQQLWVEEPLKLLNIKDLPYMNSFGQERVVALNADLKGYDIFTNWKDKMKLTFNKRGEEAVRGRYHKEWEVRRAEAEAEVRSSNGYCFIDSEEEFDDFVTEKMEAEVDEDYQYTQEEAVLATYITKVKNNKHSLYRQVCSQQKELIVRFNSSSCRREEFIYSLSSF
jgi:hypothetical protein